jgi:Na+/H+-dicarboxylate symporter
VKLNEPHKLDKYIREEAAKLLHREPERVYWFVTQASFKPLLDELELTTTVVAVAVTVTGSLVAEDVEDFEDVEHLCKSCLTLSLSLSLSIGVLGAVSGAVCVCGHCQLFHSFVVCVCVCIGVIFHSFVVFWMCVCVCGHRCYFSQ